MVSEKDLIKYMKAEGDKLTPDSLNIVKTKLSTNEKYLEFKLREEGEILVPNNVDSVKNNIELKETKKVNHSWLKGLSLGITGVAAAACAIIIPVSGVLSQTSSSTLANTSVSVDLKEYSSSAKTSYNDDKTVNFTCTIDDNTNVDLTSLYSKTTNGKMAISVTRSSLDVEQNYTLKDFVETLINETKSKFFNSEFGYELNLDISSTDNEFINDLVENINDLVENFNFSKGEEFFNTVLNNHILDNAEEIYENLVNDLSDYVFGDDIDYGFDTLDFNTINSDQLKELLDELIGFSYEFIDDTVINDLQNDLENVKAIYEARKNEIQTLIDEYVSNCGYNQKIISFDWNKWYDYSLKRLEDDYNDFIENIEDYQYNENDSPRKKYKKFQTICNILEENELWYSQALSIIKNPDYIEHEPSDKPNDWSSHNWGHDDIDWDEYYSNRYRDYQHFIHYLFDEIL